MKTKMILLLDVLTVTIICAMADVSPTVYQIEENNNLNISWDSQTQIDVSLTHLKCYFESQPLQVFYQMIEGVEDTESQHQQFAGRVQLDKDAMTGGRIRLHLSTVTAGDSGSYRCYLAVNYTRRTKAWASLTSEAFVLNVSRPSDGDNSDASLNTTSGPTPAEGSNSQRDSSPRYVVGVVVFAVLVAGLVYSLLRKMTPCNLVSLGPHGFNTGAFSQKPPHKELIMTGDDIDV